MNNVKRRFGAVVFDCDSTLSAIEGIEELARDHRAEIVALTEQAMEGSVALEDIYARRLEIVQPTREQLDRVGALYVERLVPGAREAIARLQREGVDVAIVSGGLLPAVLWVARDLGVPDDRVAAVDVYFDEDGTYRDFDRSSPLARSGGKGVLLREWRRRLGSPLMLVGDGATDLEAKDEVDLFVAFAGVAERAAVVAAAEVVVRENSLLPIVPLALGG